MTDPPVDDDPHPSRALPDDGHLEQSVRPSRAFDDAVEATSDAVDDTTSDAVDDTTSDAVDDTTSDAVDDTTSDVEAAWQQVWVRRLAHRRRVLPVVALSVGLLAVAGCVALVLSGNLEQLWGLPALVVGAGLGGGCLAGGVLGLIGYRRMRRVLQSGAWENAALELGRGSHVRLLPTPTSEEDDSPAPLDLDLEVRTARLGDHGRQLPVHYLRHDDRVVLATTAQDRLIRTWPSSGSKA